MEYLFGVFSQAVTAVIISWLFLSKFWHSNSKKHYISGENSVSLVATKYGGETLAATVAQTHYNHHNKMEFEEYIPTALLRPFIKAYRIIESQNEMTNRVLPNTSLAIAFRYKGQVSYITNNNQENLPASTISGLRKSVRLIHYFNDTATIIILFNETGAKAFFKQPIYELFEKSVSLDNFIAKQETTIIEEQLAEAKNNIQRIIIIENFLLSKIVDHRSDKLIPIAIEKINSTKGSIKIKELASTLYISNDAFEKRFRKEVGTSPKRFSSIVRLNSIIKLREQNQSFADIIFEAGYYDKPHFHKEFKLFTGQTPSEFFKETSFW